MGPLLDFSDRIVVITGAATGMGEATTNLLLQAGAAVHTVDLAPIDRSDVASHECDLGDPTAIDDLVRALPRTVDVLMNCAGIPNGGRFSPEQVMRVNWLGLRSLTEQLLPAIPTTGAVVHIASTAGRAWSERALAHAQLMAAESFDDGLEWIRSHSDLVGDGYAFSKEAVQFYTLWRSVQLLPTGIRMNSVCPGITDTSIIGDFRKGMGDELIDRAQSIAGRMAQPEEMAPAMLFLADHASSSYVNGVNLNIDRGTGAARESGQDDAAQIWARD